MIKIILAQMPERKYKNNGQEAERRFRFTLTQKDCKADNTPATKGCDIFGISIKSARATICKGTDIIEHLITDKATHFAYVSTDLETAYIMTKNEYINFINAFAKPSRSSSKNGGTTVLRLSAETQKMREWLALRI